MLLKAIRVHQFAKNSLIFLPLFLGHLYTRPHNIKLTLMGFMVFCCIAASVYLLNDLLDLNSDRLHHHKKKRVLANGDFSLIHACLLMPVFFCAGIYLASKTSGRFLELVFCYYVLTLLYSFYLKRQRLLDVFTLTALYVIRIIAGIVLLNLVPSQWLIAFSVFFFFSLALVKRYSELYQLKLLKKSSMNDKMYSIQDMDTIKIMGITSGFCSIIILSLYINSPQMHLLYTNGGWLWGSVLLMLYWITRLWMLTIEGLVSEDPVVHCIKDKNSWVVLIIILCLFYLAIG